MTIPQDEIDRIKREVSLKDLVEAAGIELKKHGDNYIGLCPFHNDTNPSFVVTPSTNLFHCLGLCSFGGDNHQFTMKFYHLSFPEAHRKLGGRPNGTQPTSTKTKSSVTIVPQITHQAPVQEDFGLLQRAIAFYHETLKRSPEALAFLEMRGLNQTRLIEHFKLGFSNRSLGRKLDEGDETEIREKLAQLGIFRPSGHEHFNGSLVVPVMDAEGRITEIYGRKTGKWYRKGTVLHQYLPAQARAGRPRGVFNPLCLAATPDGAPHEIILCEALLDALTFWVNGFENVTSSYGVNGFSDELFHALKACGVQRVYIAYDHDEAGIKKGREVAEMLMAEGIGCYRVWPPKGLDINEYAIKVTPATKSLALLIEHAEWLGDGAEKKAIAPEICQPKPVPIQETIPPEMEAKPVEPHEPQSAQPTEEPPKVNEPEKPATPTVLVKESKKGIAIEIGDRSYHARGLEQNLSFDSLKISLIVTRGEAFHLDHLNLHSDRQRSQFVQRASKEIGLKEQVIKKDLGQVLLKLEELQEKHIEGTLEKEEDIQLTETERLAALDLLQDPNLIERILKDYAHCGLVGEESNKLLGYLAAVSRLLLRPLAVIVQSSSAAGKTALMEGILGFMPREHVVKYSAMTGQSLYYMTSKSLKHRILALVEEEGAERASYSLKLLQSEGELSIASTGKDPKTGKMSTCEYHVEGPVMIMLTTTAVDLDDELLNRCLVLTVNEGRDQTSCIHQAQRESETLSGFLTAQKAAKRMKVHGDAQRLLQPLRVFNPFAKYLTFRNDRTRMRRDHAKYLILIKSVTLLHQYQRTQQRLEIEGESVPYLEVTLQDIAIANQLGNEVFGRTLDELPPQTRQLLKTLDRMVIQRMKAQSLAREDVRFSRRDVRDEAGWSDSQIKAHMGKLEALEYVVIHRGKRGQSYVYELLYNGEGLDGQSFALGLIDVEQLKTMMEKDKPGCKLEGPVKKKEGSPPRVGPLKDPRSLVEKKELIH